jgi:hypothetical protein
VANGIKKLKDARKAGGQTRMDSFFKVTPGSGSGSLQLGAKRPAPADKGKGKGKGKAAPAKKPRGGKAKK